MPRRTLTGRTSAAALVLASLVAGATPVVEASGAAPPREAAARFAERQVLLVRRLVPGSADVVVGARTRGSGHVATEVRFTTPRGPDGLSVRVDAPGRSTPAGVCAAARCTGAVGQHDGGLVVFAVGARRRAAHGFRGNGEVVSASVAASSSVADRALAWFATDRVLTFADQPVRAGGAAAPRPR
ncbi:hypothetical protein [Saccharothrix yanglingensis]|uniref:hypothetical protein n=1 Tax=Saccharothrix yanglingensis TaxID=659496 RepID=UPI0027D1F4F0|nr:hypothetical protein [Saccharothrix yanglingensis]